MTLLMAWAVLTGCVSNGQPWHERLANHVVKSYELYYDPEDRKRAHDRRTVRAIREHWKGRRSLPPVKRDDVTGERVIDYRRVDVWRLKDEDGRPLPTKRDDVTGERVIDERWVDPEDLAKAISEATR